jgi:hypothetical protein
VIHGRFAKRGSRQTDRLQPKIFDFALPFRVVGEQVARNAHPLAVEAECVAKEPHERSHHFGIRVGEDELVATPRSLCPVEHAAHDVEVPGAPGATPPVTLRLESASAGFRAQGGTCEPLSLVESVSGLQSGVLLGSQLDVADPKADGGFRGSDESGNLLYRSPLFFAHRPCLVSLGCFHF